MQRLPVPDDFILLILLFNIKTYSPIKRPSQGFRVSGNRGIMSFISGEQGNKSLKLKGTEDQRQLWGAGNIENQYFDFGEQGNMPIFQGNKGTGTPTPIRPLLGSPKGGLNK